MTWRILALCLSLWATPAWAMTDDQLSAVLAWKYPAIGAAYSVINGEVVFQLWLDRATNQPSATPKPTMAQLEAWLPGLPGKTDVAGFKAALKADMGQATMRTLMRTYAEALPALDAGNWAWFQQSVIDAKAAADLSQAQYDAIKAAAAAYSIPITLP